MNVVDPQSDISLREIASFLAKEAGTKVVYELPDEIERTGYSAATKAVLGGTRLVQLGWKAFTPIEQGLCRTVQILRQTKERKY